SPGHAGASEVIVSPGLKKKNTRRPPPGVFYGEELVPQVGGEGRACRPGRRAGATVRHDGLRGRERPHNACEAPCRPVDPPDLPGSDRLGECCPSPLFAFRTHPRATLAHHFQLFTIFFSLPSPSATLPWGWSLLVQPVHDDGGEIRPGAVGHRPRADA